MRLFISVLILFVSTTAFGQAVPAIYQELSNAYEEENFTKILQMEDEVLAALGSEHDTLLAHAYAMVGDAHYMVADINEAVAAFENAKKLLSSSGESDSESYNMLLFNLITLYDELGQYDKAIALGDELLILDEQYFGTDSEEYASSVRFFCDVLVKSEQYDKARKILRKALRNIDTENPSYPMLLTIEADIHSIVGHYSRAEKKFIESMKLIEQTRGTESAVYASISSNLAIMYSNQGRYPQAEELLLHATDVLKEQQTDNGQYINSLNNLALVHLSLNQHDKALEELNKVLEHDRQIYGDDHPYLALTLSNIGTAHNDMNEYEKAEAVLQQALSISEKQMGNKSISYAVDANNLASMYRKSGQPEKAIPLYKEAIAIFKDALGTKDPDYIKTLYNLGLANFILEKKEARKQLRKSLKSRKRVFNKNHPTYAESAGKLAYWYWHNAKRKRATTYFDDVFENYFHQINSYFPVLSEDEKVNFFSKKIKTTFESYNNFVLQHYQDNPQLLEKMLDNQLNTKALIMYATNKVRESISSSGDSVLVNQYEEWLSLKEQMATLFSSQEPGNNQAIDSLSRVAESLEKEIGRKSAAFTSTYLKQRVQWKELQEKLKPGEAIIEIIRFRGFEPASGGNFTDEIHYVGLIFTHESQYPQLIEIPEGRLMEERYIKNYRNAIQFRIIDEYSYEKIWQPIKAHLDGINKVYFSPDGVYNQVNINTLYNPETGKYLLDEIDVRVLTNSKDLLSAREMDINENQALLIGYPNYNIYKNESNAAQLRGGMRGANSEISTTESLTRGLNRGMRAGLLRYMRGEEGIAMLPGTKTEVENIGELLKERNVEQTVVMEDEASEHMIKNIKNPKTLHIATHGFFLPDVENYYLGGDNKYVENPLLRSGLILSGAGDFLITGSPVDSTGQDGILTAYEAMNLNLNDTELVVLSACETGLGDIQNGEGVYGLQRAFFIAGAENLIMSMWSVDDDATQELMTAFYKEWVKTNNQQEAFRKAQQYLREKYEDPFYWGAFIMVGV